MIENKAREGERERERERGAGARACRCAIVKVHSLTRSHMLVCMCSHESHGIPLRFHELKEVTKRPLIMLMVQVILLIYDVNHNVSIRVSFIFF